MKNPVKKAIRERRITIGSWLQTGSNITAEIMANAGFEWLAMDAEHGGIDIEKIHKNRLSFYSIRHGYDISPGIVGRIEIAQK